MTWADVRRRIWSDKTLWATPNVRRVFLRCDRCRRVIPIWRMIGPLPRPSGCRCGCVKAWPSQIPEWQAAYWLLIRGWAVRHLIQRRPDWDPRMPMREGVLPS